MGYKNREVEIKLMANSSSLPNVMRDVEAWVESINPVLDYLEGNATDLYWDAPERGKGDFVRLRRNSTNAQITMKGTDKGDIINRIEIDLEVEDYKQSKILMEALHGEPVEKVKKKYHVFFLENDDTTISIYQVAKDDRVFVEVEARTKTRVKALVKSLMSYSKYRYDWINSSLYNIFVEKSIMHVLPPSDFLENKRFD